jgi:3-hydroxybutyrate dehydrogenase
MNLKGKSAVVTGSTSGIGLAMATSLAKAGCGVMLNGLGDAGEIEKVRSGLAKAANTKVVFSPADMTKPDQIRGMIADATRELGGVDILVNNAGIQFVSPIDEFPEAKWDAIIAINLTSAFHGIKAALPGMRARRWGRIINLASAHGLVASAFKSAYVAAKHGVVGLTKTVAMETAEQGITCNAICPGYVRTPLVEKQIDEQAKAHGIPRERVVRDILLANQPNKAFIEADALGDITVFLCSDAAAGITGIALPVDGGWTAH